VDEMQKWQEHEDEIVNLKDRVSIVEQQSQEFHAMTKKMQEDYEIKLQSVKNDVQSLKNDVQGVSISQGEIKNTIERFGTSNQQNFQKVLDHILGTQTEQKKTNKELELARNKSKEKITIAKLSTTQKIWVGVFGSGSAAGIVLAVVELVKNF
jgi:hypothetical protein